MNSRVAGGVCTLGIVTSFSNGFVSAEDYEYQYSYWADFECPKGSSLSKGLTETIQKAIEANGEIGFQEGCMKADRQEYEKYPESLIAKKLLKASIDKEIEEIKKAKENRDVFIKIATGYIKINNLEEYFPFLPWDSLEKMEEIITAKEPNFFNPDFKYMDNIKEDRYLNDETLKDNYDIFGDLIFDYSKYLGAIDYLKQQLNKPEQERISGNFLLPKDTIKKQMASYWLAKNIAEIEINKKKSILSAQRVKANSNEKVNSKSECFIF